MLQRHWLPRVRTAALLLVFTALLYPSAQAIGPHGDAFVGFSTFGSQHNGAEAALHVKLLPFTGLDADLSGYQNGHDAAANQIYLFLVGPRVTVPLHHLHLFAHAQVGGLKPGGGTTSSSFFVYSLGGGLDLPVFSRLNWRLAADRIDSPNGANYGGRFSTGPVLRF